MIRHRVGPYRRAGFIPGRAWVSFVCSLLFAVPARRAENGKGFEFQARDFPCSAARSLRPWTFAMIAPETFNHIENIKKRAGHLWRFL